MGKRGEKRTTTAKVAADALVQRLGGLAGVRSKGMFGGYGIFRDDTMFGLVNASGQAHFRVDAVTEPKYTAMDASKHGRMPYYAVPDQVFADDAALLAWATEAAEVAGRTKG